MVVMRSEDVGLYSMMSCGMENAAVGGTFGWTVGDTGLMPNRVSRAAVTRLMRLR